jgi:hypothetical protein
MDFNLHGHLRLPTPDSFANTADYNPFHASSGLYQLSNVSSVSMGVQTENRIVVISANSTTTNFSNILRTPTCNFQTTWPCTLQVKGKLLQIGFEQRISKRTSGTQLHIKEDSHDAEKGRQRNKVRFTNKCFAVNSTILTLRTLTQQDQ